MRIPVSQHPQPVLVILTVVAILVIFTVVSHCGFDLDFSDE